jgi:hypothetical protein
MYILGQELNYDNSAAPRIVVICLDEHLSVCAGTNSYVRMAAVAVLRTRCNAGPAV